MPVLRIPEQWRTAFPRPPAGAVIAVDEVGDDWDSVSAELTAVFEASQAAARQGDPIVYVVRTDDLLGRRGAGRAMVACGVLSAARTAALELLEQGLPVNVLALEEDTPAAAVSRWAVRLLEPDGPTGELVHLGAGHLGKALA